MAILIDSSVWISASSQKNPECSRLKKLILTNEPLYVTRPIQVEVCQGAKSEIEFHQLWNAFLGFEFLEITTQIWGNCAWNYFRLRKKGKNLSTIDCLIGTLSAEYGIPLWTLDKNLQAAHATIGFDLYRP